MEIKYDFLDEIDIEDIHEMYDEYLISQLNEENVKKIYSYLIEQGIYYAKDIFIERLELFTIDSEEFIEKFEKIKQKIGNDYVDEIIEDSDLLDELY